MERTKRWDRVFGVAPVSDIEHAPSDRDGAVWKEAHALWLLAITILTRLVVVVVCRL